MYCNKKIEGAGFNLTPSPRQPVSKVDVRLNRVKFLQTNDFYKIDKNQVIARVSGEWIKIFFNGHFFTINTFLIKLNYFDNTGSELNYDKENTARCIVSQPGYKEQGDFKTFLSDFLAFTSFYKIVFLTILLVIPSIKKCAFLLSI